MDRVRFGRVLGRGARMAARTAIEAVDAATATPPGSGRPPSRVPEHPVHPPVRRVSMPQVLSPGTLLPAARAAGAGVLTPLRQASRALWHELTGSFFALFALSFGAGVWHTRRDALSTVSADRHRLAAFCALTLLFAYFSISSFVRARKRAVR